MRRKTKQNKKILPRLPSVYDFEARLLLFGEDFCISCSEGRLSLLLLLLLLLLLAPSHHSLGWQGPFFLLLQKLGALVSLFPFVGRSVHFNRCLSFESARLFRTERARGHAQEYQIKVSRKEIHLLYAYAISLDVLMMYMIRNPTLMKQSSVLSDLFFCNSVTK